MGFDLRIRFEGLCLWVPDKANSRMHVLMPSTPAAMRHYARLVYDGAYEGSKNTQYLRSLECLDLENKALELSQLVAVGPDLSLPTEIPPLLDTSGSAVTLLPAMVGSNPGGTVISRVTLPAGLLTDYSFGGAFTLRGGAPMRITWRAEWTIRNISNLPNSLPAHTLAGLNGNSPGNLKELHPIGDTIHLTIYHAVAAELPPGGDYYVPNVLAKPDHLHHFEGMAKKTLEIPDPANPQPAIDVRCNAPGDGHGLLTATTMTCIMTQAKLQ